MGVSSLSITSVSGGDGINSNDLYNGGNLTVTGTADFSNGNNQARTITIEASFDNGATWVTVGSASLAANNGAATGVAWSGTITNVAPFANFTNTAIFRANTGSNSGGGGQLVNSAQVPVPVVNPVCFYAGTLIATPAGAVAVETLKAGDLVLTADGRSVAVRWMGRQAIAPRFADPAKVLPVRIRAGALAENLPARDLLLSPGHAILLDGVLVNAGALVNGTTITRESDVPEVFTYWHIETADHSLVLAEGVASETFLDEVDRQAFDNYDEYLALVGEPAPIPAMELPRARSSRQVSVATRARIAERAEALLGSVAAAA